MRFSTSDVNWSMLVLILLQVNSVLKYRRPTKRSLQQTIHCSIIWMVCPYFSVIIASKLYRQCACCLCPCPNMIANNLIDTFYTSRRPNFELKCYNETRVKSVTNKRTADPTIRCKGLIRYLARKSDMATVEFGVPQGSIPGSVIFNLFVAGLQSELQCDCQYADDMTFYFHSKPCDLDSSADHINKAVTSLRDYSKSCNLALNSSKTSWMLISTPQMTRYHSLEERKLPIACGDTPLKRISCTKLFGVHVNQHLTWKTHVDHVLSLSYGTLSVLRRLKNLASFYVRKHLLESSVLSKVNYAFSVFHPLPAFQMKGLQGLQNACPGFVTRKFAGVEDVVKLNWLPVNKNVELNILKLTHKSLYDETFPEYLKFNLHKVSAYSLIKSDFL